MPRLRPGRLNRMDRHGDRRLRIEFDAALGPSIARLSDLLGDVRAASLAPATVEAAFSARGFRRYPTWPQTTVFYDSESDCFFKILNRRPRTLRGRVHSRIFDRARRIHALSRWLVDRGVPIPEVRAFGTVREGRRPLYAIARARGRSLYDLLVREQGSLPPALGRKVVDAVAGLHCLGYWLGDAHLSHVFVHEGEVSGFIDIDSIRPNRPPRLANLARDLGRPNHPAVRLARADGDSLLRRYATRMNVRDVEALERLVEGYSSTRWRSAAPDPEAGAS